MKLLLAPQTLHGTRSDEILRVWCSTCPGHESACLEDGGIDRTHQQASLKAAADPDGGPYPPYPSEKSWDEASRKTGSGKKFCHNVISGADFAAQPTLRQLSFQGSITAWVDWKLMRTPLSWDLIQRRSALNAAGEVAAGVHGNNRWCVVFGRVAGVACRWRSSQVGVSLGKLRCRSCRWVTRRHDEFVIRGTVKKRKEASSGHTMDEVAKHTKKVDVWVVLHGTRFQRVQFPFPEPWR